MKTRAEAVYDFSTLWTMARELLELKWATVYLVVLDVQEIGNGLVSFAAISRLRYWQVWPGTFKRERLPTVDEPHFPEEAKKQQPKTKRGGIKILPPNGIQHAPEEVCDYGSETSEDDPPPAPPYEPSDPAEPPPRPPPCAPPPPAAEPAECQPCTVPAVLRAKPWQYSFKWGRYLISRVRSDGIQIGWGLTCGLHNDRDAHGNILNTSPCKKQLTYGQEALSDAECVVRLKRWAKVKHDGIIEHT